MLARSPRRIGHALALATLVYTTPGASAPAAVFAGAAELLPWERQVLSSGGRVERPLSFSPGRGSYVGGIAYQVVHRSPAEVLSALSDVRRLSEMLPRTRSARLVSSEPGRARIELQQGQPPFLATYTIVLERAGDNDELRFWLDPAAPHDIRDVFGFFLVRPLGPFDSVLTVGAAVDLGPGLFNGLFESKVQAVVLRSVTGIRDFMEPGRMALVGY